MAILLGILIVIAWIVIKNLIGAGADYANYKNQEQQSDIENYIGWKLLGDFIVAKEVKDGNLLIRKIWQRHPWQYKDMMLYKLNPYKNDQK